MGTVLAFDDLVKGTLLHILHSEPRARKEGNNDTSRLGVDNPAKPMLLYRECV